MRVFVVAQLLFDIYVFAKGRARFNLLRGSILEHVGLTDQLANQVLKLANHRP